jgi:hypothetical protein
MAAWSLEATKARLFGSERRFPGRNRWLPSSLGFQFLTFEILEIEDVRRQVNAEFGNCLPA